MFRGMGVSSHGTARTLELHEDSLSFDFNPASPISTSAALFEMSSQWQVGERTPGDGLNPSCLCERATCVLSPSSGCNPNRLELTTRPIAFSSRRPC